MTLRSLLRGWMERYFSDEEAVILLLVLVLASRGDLAWPDAGAFPDGTGHRVFAARRGQRPDAPSRAPSAGGTAGVSRLSRCAAGHGLILMPLIWNQMVNLLQETPRMFASGSLCSTISRPVIRNW